MAVWANLHIELGGQAEIGSLHLTVEIRSKVVDVIYPQKMIVL